MKKYKQVKLKKVDLTNYKTLSKIIKKNNPDVIFHMASNANVRESFDKPIKFIKNNNTITANLLECIRVNNLNPIILICSSSEVYGNVEKKYANKRKSNYITNKSICRHQSFSRYNFSNLL